MPFRITQRIHFGYTREPGVYDDLTEADMDNLAAARPGLPAGYGHRVDDDGQRVPPTPEPATEEPSHASNLQTTSINHGGTDEPQPPAGGTEPHDPPPPPTDPQPESLSCPAGCNDGQPFGSRAALASHRRAKQH